MRTTTMNATEQIVEELKAEPHTYLEMQRLFVSTSPHKRVLEWVERNPQWEVRKTLRFMGTDAKPQYLTQWQVVPKRIAMWTP
jgi:hypothetical protein